jgi:hypothetical protein
MKILVSGDVNGRFSALFSRISSIIKKTGDFDLLLCVGSFFAGTDGCRKEWDDVKTSALSAPLPIFVLGPDKEECCHYYDAIPPAGGELAENITCLGQRGIYTTSSGLQIAYISGNYDSSHYKTPHTDPSHLSVHYNDEDVQSLCRLTEDVSFKGVDILMTSEWPKNVFNHTTPPAEIPGFAGSVHISQLAVALSPRYHFVGSLDMFYERHPYRNPAIHSQHACRFIALANVGNPDKKNKHLYAFTLTPLRHIEKDDKTLQPDHITECPYTDILPHNMITKGKGGHVGAATNFFFDAESIEQQRRESRKRPHNSSGGGRAGVRTKIPAGPCWFCLSSPDLEKHLIASIGEHSYIALAKGGLVDEHLLIIPIGHYSSSLHVPKEELEEIEHFKMSLVKYFNSQNKTCVIFERNFHSQHLQIQVIPIPMMDSDHLRRAFIDKGKHHNIEFVDIHKGQDLSEVSNFMSAI